MNESYQAEQKKSQKEEEERVQQEESSLKKEETKSGDMGVSLNHNSNYNPFLSVGVMLLLNKLLVFVCLLCLKPNHLVFY